MNLAKELAVSGALLFAAGTGTLGFVDAIQPETCIVAPAREERSPGRDIWKERYERKSEIRECTDSIDGDAKTYIAMSLTVFMTIGGYKLRGDKKYGGNRG